MITSYHTDHTVLPYLLLEVWIFLAKHITQNQLHNTVLAPWQYWLGITKPQSALSTTVNVPNRLL